MKPISKSAGDKQQQQQSTLLPVSYKPSHKAEQCSWIERYAGTQPLPWCALVCVMRCMVSLAARQASSPSCHQLLECPLWTAFYVFNTFSTGTVVPQSARIHIQFRMVCSAHAPPSTVTARCFPAVKKRQQVTRPTYAPQQSLSAARAPKGGQVSGPQEYLGVLGLEPWAMPGPPRCPLSCRPALAAASA
mmetsp:Transcript_15918/g.34374  ORF Transcript_15918/g.34374 Transcript_15918/m.34374 type:complete len:190 (-) Transcript_15918:1543-2112(-)